MLVETRWEALVVRLLYGFNHDAAAKAAWASLTDVRRIEEPGSDNTTVEETTHQREQVKVSGGRIRR